MLSAKVSDMIELDVLNTGTGHLRLTFNPGEPAEVEKAKTTINLLLRRGFALFVQEGTKTRRVRGFDPERGSYYVDDVPEEAEQAKAEADATPGGLGAVAAADRCACGKPARHRGRCKGRAGRRSLPAATHRATAVGRTAGG